jgi:hypothetical protein
MGVKAELDVSLAGSSFVFLFRRKRRLIYIKCFSSVWINIEEFEGLPFKIPLLRPL